MVASDEKWRTNIPESGPAPQSDHISILVSENALSFMSMIDNQ